MLSLIDRLLVERPTLSVLVTTGTVTSARLLATPAAGRPRLASIRAGRPARLCAALPRPLAARSRALGRIRAVAQPHRRDARARHSAAAAQRPHVAALVPRLAARAGPDRAAARRASICAWRRTRRRPSASRASAPPTPTTRRRSQGRGGAAAGGRGRVRASSPPRSPAGRSGSPPARMRARRRSPPSAHRAARARAAAAS